MSTDDEAIERAIAAVRPALATQLDAGELDAFVTRARLSLPAALEALHGVYGEGCGGSLLAELLARVAEAAVQRRPELRRLDRRREIDPAWYLSPRMVGYVCYADRFAGSIAGVAGRLDHLQELGVTYLHLMPVLRPRAGENDGGYAVADYRAVDPRLGTMDDLEQLADLLRERGISLCVDVVVNHTADDHAWAVAAKAGDTTYRAYYLTFPDRTEPDSFEATLRDVFPETAPGSFTWVPEMSAWTWTTFHPYQWDLDYSNPAVFAEMLDVMLYLANRGVEVLRLDAVPFTWKRLGTSCQNEPEAHLLLQAFRALVRVAAPAVLFKAEAIVAPDELVQYLGAHDRDRQECDLAYNNQLMVMGWSSLAARDARLAARALAAMATSPPGTSWCTYVRCHDDIGWAVRDDDAAAVGWSGPGHRRFLADFYAGRFPGSFAAGEDFQNDPGTGDVRTSGSAASLAGLECASSPESAALALRRVVALYAIAYSYGGIPLLYMGDELAQPNDRGFAADPAHAADNRWLHRPAFDAAAAAARHDPSTVAGAAFAWFMRLAAVRRRLDALTAATPAVPVDSGHPQVLAYRRKDRRTGPFLALVNFSEQEAAVPRRVLEASGVDAADLVLASEPTPVTDDSTVRLAPVAFAWFAVTAA